MCLAYNLKLVLMCQKLVVSDSPRLVDFAAGRVDSLPYFPLFGKC